MTAWYSEPGSLALKRDALAPWHVSIDDYCSEYSCGTTKQTFQLAENATFVTSELALVLRNARCFLFRYS